MAKFEKITLQTPNVTYFNKNQPVNYNVFRDTISSIENQMNKWANNALGNLDHLNVRRLYTNYCDIKSENGETIIDGAQLLQYKSGDTTLRLAMGYNPVSSNFEFVMTDINGNVTASLNSSGQLEVKRLIGGYVYGSTIEGGTITGSTINGGYINGSTINGAYINGSTINGGNIIGGNVIGSKFLNTDQSMEVSFSSNEFRVKQTTAIDTIFSIYANSGVTYVSANGSVDNFAMTDTGITAYGDWNFTGTEHKFNGTRWGIFNNVSTQQSAALLGSKATIETASSSYTIFEQSMLNNLKADMQSVYNKVDGILNKLYLYGIFLQS